MNKFLEKTNPVFIGFLVFSVSASITPIASRALSNPVFMLIPILLGVVTGRIHYVLKNKNENRLRCPKCKTINFTWRVKPERVEVIQKSEVYLKEISEEVGFTETDTYGEIIHPRRGGPSDSSYYSGTSTSSHYEYRKRPHQTITYREIFSCTHCQTKIGRRRQVEKQINEN